MYVTANELYSMAEAMKHIFDVVGLVVGEDELVDLAEAENWDKIAEIYNTNVKEIMKEVESDGSETDSESTV